MVAERRNDYGLSDLCIEILDEMTVSKTTSGNSGMRGPCNGSSRRASAWALTMLVCVTWAESAVGGVCPSWALQVSGTTDPLRTVHFPAGDVNGFAGGNNGTIRRTTDGGATWVLSPSGIPDTINSLHFPLRSTTGWEVADAGKILKTTDGGASWTPQVSGTAEKLKGVHFPVDELTGYVVGDNGVILQTTDGGGTWIAQPPAAAGLSAVQFPAGSVTIGYAVGAGGLIIKTTDGFASFVVQVSGIGTTLTGVNFPVNASTGWVVGNAGAIRKTTDGGATPWSGQAAAPVVNYDDVQFPTDNSTGYVIGKTGFVWDTTDGGATWVLDGSVPTAEDLRAIHFPVNALTGYIAGNNGLIMKCGTGGGGPDPLILVKAAFETDGTPIPTGATIPMPVEFKYLLYINNQEGARSDVSVRNVLDAAFQYQAGTIQVDNSVAECALTVCTAAEELTIFTAVNGAAFLTDAVDGDVASYTGASTSVDAGNSTEANAQLNINADAVWAILFSVKMQ